MDGNRVGSHIGRNGIRVEKGYTFNNYYRVRNASDEEVTSKASTNRGWFRRKDASHVKAIPKTPLR